MNKKLLLIFLSALPLAACGSEPIEPVNKEAGTAFYRETCIPCHGATGRGDGPTAASLDPKPRDLSDPEWQASVDDEYIAKIIKLGGAAVGKNPNMPANPQLNSNRSLVNGIVAHVRGLARKE